jgi:hypothetical protein
MIDIVEILSHWYAGRSQNELATSLGVDRKTLRKYTGPARAAGWPADGHIGDRLDVRATESMVQLFHHGQLVKTHPRKDRGKQTDLGDYPPETIAFHMRTPTWCRRQAADIGPACDARRCRCESSRNNHKFSPCKPLSLHLPSQVSGAGSGHL